jgi:uncharacterized protein YbjT (DUF2867 family)
VNVLVVGATGTLGSDICRRALDAGHGVRALVRPTSAAERVDALKSAGADPFEGDLKDPPSIERAMDSMDAVVSSATSVHARRDRDDFESVDGAGQRGLVDAAADAGARIVYVSYSGGIPAEQPLGRAKRATEERIRSSGADYAILRPTFFTEIWLGPRLCIDVEAGTAEVYGSGEAPVSWISYHDVARFAVAALDNESALGRTLDLGGPRALSQLEAVDIFQEETGRELRVHHVPEAVLEEALESAEHDLAQTFAGLKLAVARGDVVDMEETADEFGIPLRSVRDHARAVAAP